MCLAILVPGGSLRLLEAANTKTNIKEKTTKKAVARDSVKNFNGVF